MSKWPECMRCLKEQSLSELQKMTDLIWFASHFLYRFVLSLVDFASFIRLPNDLVGIQAALNGILWFCRDLLLKCQLKEQSIFLANLWNRPLYPAFAPSNVGGFLDLTHGKLKLQVWGPNFCILLPSIDFNVQTFWKKWQRDVVQIHRSISQGDLPYDKAGRVVDVTSQRLLDMFECFQTHVKSNGK